MAEAHQASAATLTAKARPSPPLPHAPAPTPGSATQPVAGDSVRVLLVLDTRMLVELIKLTLNHGVYVVDVAPSAAAAVVRLPEMQPHLVILDMDLDGQWVMQQIQASNTHAARVPVLGLTRRGDLKTKLAAFDAGVDDILTMPLSPEELLARVIALVRRSYGDSVTFTPTIKLGELEIDILNRIVRAGSSVQWPQTGQCKRTSTTSLSILRRKRLTSHRTHVSAGAPYPLVCDRYDRRQ